MATTPHRKANKNTNKKKTNKTTSKTPPKPIVILDKIALKIQNSLCANGWALRATNNTKQKHHNRKASGRGAKAKQHVAETQGPPSQDPCFLAQLWSKCLQITRLVQPSDMPSSGLRNQKSRKTAMKHLTCSSYRNMLTKLRRPKLIQQYCMENHSGKLYQCARPQNVEHSLLLSQ